MALPVHCRVGVSFFRLVDGFSGGTWVAMADRCRCIFFTKVRALRNGRVMFVEGRPGKGYKLATNKEGRTPNYYIKFSGPANLKVYNIIRRSLGEDGSVSFDLDELEVEYMTDREPLEEPKTMTGEEVAIKSLTMRVEALEKCVANLIEKKTAAPDDWKAKLIETINSL